MKTDTPEQQADTEQRARALLASKRWKLTTWIYVKRGPSPGYHIAFRPADGISGLPQHTYAKTADELISTLRLWGVAGNKE